ncbi:13816_t:CDS:1, partial [Funneliformis geosporum]
STKFTSPLTNHNSLSFPRVCRLFVEWQLRRFSCERIRSIFSLNELLLVSSTTTLRTQHMNVEDYLQYSKNSPALYT